MARAATPQGRIALQNDPRANAARERFNDLQGQATARATGGDGADVLFDAREAVMSVFALAGRDGAPRAAVALAALRDEYAIAATRLRDLGEIRGFPLRGPARRIEKSATSPRRARRPVHPPIRGTSP